MPASYKWKGVDWDKEPGVTAEKKEEEMWGLRSDEGNGGRLKSNKEPGCREETRTG